MLKEVKAEIQVNTERLNLLIDLKFKIKELLKDKLSSEEFELICQTSEDIANITNYLNNLHKDVSIIETSIKLSKK